MSEVPARYRQLRQRMDRLIKELPQVDPEEGYLMSSFNIRSVVQMLRQTEKTYYGYNDPYLVGMFQEVQDHVNEFIEGYTRWINLHPQAYQLNSKACNGLLGLQVFLAKDNRELKLSQEINDILIIHKLSRD